MRRRRHGAEAHENHERWLVSYADFITLMFAFFVVMFASSQSDKYSTNQISEAVSRALEEGKITSKVRNVLSGGKPAARRSADAKNLPDLTASMEQLTKELEEEIRAGKIQISLEARGLVVSLKEATFFPSGDSTIPRDVYPAIARLASTIRKLPNPVRLEGHTDAIPIRNGRFKSNWHLSAARSIAMLELFTDEFQIPAERLAVVGYGETIAVDTNDTAEGRARNRRVDVTILNESATGQEPGAPRKT